MKRPSILLGLLLMLAGSCREIGPAVDLGLNILRVDTVYTESPAAKAPITALIEEFTGVRCVNCPRAHRLIETLQGQYPGRVLAAGIHTGFYATPYPNRLDLRIPEGPALELLLGGTLGYPAGAVNRTRFAGENLMLLSDQKWSSHVADLMDDSASVRLEMLSSGYSAATNRIEGRLRLRFAAPVNPGPTFTPLYLTLYLLQNNLLDWQLDGGGIDSQYVHRHVVRRLITPVNGMVLNAPDYRAGRVIEIEFKHNLGNLQPLPVWNDCKWLAVVHQNRNNDLTMVQAAQFPFVTN
jgi:hypothetical protein